jgi:hypothetical protein
VRFSSGDEVPAFEIGVVMRILIRAIAVLVMLSVIVTFWFIAGFARTGGLGGLLTAGALGVLTILAWAITIIVGPVAALQLWRYRETGRLAGLMFFGSGLAYYVIGLGIRTAEASVWPILIAAGMFALPLFILLLPRVRAQFG